MSLADLATCQLWWTGPEFLCGEPDNWPKNKIDTPQKIDTEKRKQCQHSMAKPKETAQTKPEEKDRLDPDRYSSWKKMTRVYAWITRFLDNCRRPPDLRQQGPLTPDEITDAELHYIRKAQTESFPGAIQQLRSKLPLRKDIKLSPLNPALDDDGVLRCQGRLENAACLPWQTRHPIILPRSHAVTTLIVKDAHEACLHAGTNMVLSHLSQKYWILSARESNRKLNQQTRSWPHCRR